MAVLPEFQVDAYILSFASINAKRSTKEEANEKRCGKKLLVNLPGPFPKGSLPALEEVLIVSI